MQNDLSQKQQANLKAKGNLVEDPLILSFIKSVDYKGDPLPSTGENSDDSKYIEGITKYKLDANESPSKGIQDLLPLNFTKVLVPNYKNKTFTINRLNSDYLHLLLNKASVRDALINTIVNMDTVKAILDTSLHMSNSQVYIGSVITSYTSIRDAIKQKAGINNMSSDIHIALTYLFLNYMQSYGLVLHEPEIDAFITITSGDDVNSFLNDTILNAYTSSAVGSIPEQFSMAKTHRTTTYEMAIEFVSAHATFRERLAQYDYFARAYRSVISRLNSYFSHSGFKNYGDDFETMIQSPNIASLLSYGNIVQAALNMDAKYFTNTPVRHWAAEEEKVIEGLDYLIEHEYVKVMSKIDLLKSIEVKTVYSVNDDDYTAKRYVMLGSRPVSYIKPSCYRMFRYDGLNMRMFTPESRMVDLSMMTSTFSSLDRFSLIMPFLQYYVKPLSDRYLIVDDMKEDMLQLLAMCLADGIYVDRKDFGTMYYQYKIAIEDIRTGMISAGIQDTALTTNYRFIVFNKLNSDIKQSNYIDVYQKDIEFKKGRLYLADIKDLHDGKVTDSIRDPNPLASVRLLDRKDIPTVVIEINNLTTKVKLDVYDKIFQGSLSEYVVAINPVASHNAAKFMSLLSFLKENVVNESNESLFYISSLPQLKAILQSASVFESIAYNLFWNYARKNNFIKSDVINDVMFKLSVKVISAACLAYYLDVDLSSMWDVIEYRKLEFAREVINL